MSSNVVLFIQDFFWGCPITVVIIGFILETSTPSGDDFILTCPWWEAKSGG